MSRHWNHREKKWYFHNLNNTNTVQEGYTGSYIVVILIFLLWIYSLYRLWVVWVDTLNFDGVPSFPSSIGWGFLLSWVSSGFRRKHSVFVEDGIETGETIDLANGIGRRTSTMNDIDIEEGMRYQMKNKNDKYYNNTFSDKRPAVYFIRERTFSKANVYVTGQNKKITTDV